MTKSNENEECKESDQPVHLEKSVSRESVVSRRKFVAGASAMVAGAATTLQISEAAERPMSSMPLLAHTGPVKRLQLAHPRAEINAQEFGDHWWHPHGTLVRDMRGQRSYVQHHRIVSKAFKDSDSTYLAIAEVWQDSLAAADQSKDPQFINYVQPDEPNFVDQSKHTWLQKISCRQTVVQSIPKLLSPTYIGPIWIPESTSP